MELEKSITKRIAASTDFGWICSADGDTLDVLIPEKDNIDEAVEDLQMVDSDLILGYAGEKKAIKYLVWNSKKDERSGFTDPDFDNGWEFLGQVKLGD